MGRDASPATTREGITELLRRHRAGDREAFDRLVPLVYQELRRIARRQLAQGWSNETIDPTALVHEAYLRLGGQAGVDWQGRSHFFAVSARAMRRILVDYARARRAGKRGGGGTPVPLDLVDVSRDNRLELAIAVDEALEGLETVSPRFARLVECRFFAGMTEAETSEALQVPLRTVQREWVRARAWLLAALRPS